MAATRTTHKAEAPRRSSPLVDQLGAVRVSPTSVLSWVPAEALESLGIRPESNWEFQRPDGTVFTRASASAILFVDGRATADDVIVCEAGDEPVIGWRTLRGLNLRIEEATECLVDGGPIPAAAVAA